MQDILIDQIDHDFSGILWITKDVSIVHDPYFKSMDYILDGLIHQELLVDRNKISLFFTQSFGKLFFVIHVADIGNLNNRLGTMFSGIKKQIPRRSKIIYIGQDRFYPEKAFAELVDIEIVKVKSVKRKFNT